MATPRRSPYAATPRTRGGAGSRAGRAALAALWLACAPALAAGVAVAVGAGASAVAAPDRTAADAFAAPGAAPAGAQPLPAAARQQIAAAGSAGPTRAEPTALTQQQVMAGAAVLYGERIAALRAMRLLDDDPVFHARVQRIAQTLLAQAARDFPESAAWPWEVHTTSDTEEHAYAFAGGKLLVSGAHAAALHLSDGELAMELAHEIAHAVLRHNLLEYEEALKLEPAWATRPFAELEYAVDHDGALMAKLAPLGREQELEADRAGLQLAARAGWPPHILAGYFRKVVEASSAPNAAGFAHPSPASRWRAARELARTLVAGSR